MRISEPKRLHPVAVVSTVLKQLKEMIFPILAFTVFGGRGSGRGGLSLLIPLAVVLFALITGIISWLRFTYRIEEGELRVESGVFVRKKRYIPLERIQSLDQSEGILHRAFGLVKLKVETAAHGGNGKEDAEAVFSAIPREEARQFQAILAAVKNSGTSIEADSTPESNVIYKISPKELILLASTSGGVGVIISAIIAFLSQFDEIIPFDRVFKRFESLIENGLVLVSTLVFIGFLLVWILALIGTMIKYAQFTVTKTAEDLVISRGLIEKRQITVPLNRIQSIRITQSLLRQPFGYGTVYLENAGGSAENGDLAKVMVLPIVSRTEIQEILGEWLPEYNLNPVLHPAPKRALKRYLLKGWLVILPIVFIPPFVSRPWGWLSFLLLLPVAYLQYLSYRDVGWSIEGDQLSLRYRRMVKHTVFMKKKKIQSLRTDESFFQRKDQLQSIQALVKSGLGGGGGRVVDVEGADATRIFKWFSQDK